MVIGQAFTSRTGKTFVVVSVDGKGGFTIERPATGSKVKISAGMLKKTAARMQEPGFDGFALQAYPKDGGISYTVAVVAGVVHALGLKLSANGKKWVK